MSRRIGIDVGGTNTDAVAIDDTGDLVAKTKSPTTEDVTTGIVDAMGDLLGEIAADAVEHVMLGTTHCTNAVIERRNLTDVGIVRLGAPATQAIDPLLEWPDDLAEAIGNRWTIVDGGHEYDGTEINSVDEAAVREFLQHGAAEIDAVAVTSVFSPVQDDHERRVAEIAADELGDVPVSLSHEIGSISLLERENATILNAALTEVIADASAAFRDAMAEHDVEAVLYFGQNDGTLMDVEYAESYPIFTVASGPSNSIRGAASLSDIDNGIIVDIGGTTTDVGALSDGFPRESAVAVEIGEVRTNFRMPDVLSVGLGGGSIIKEAPVRVGPDSVGYELVEEGLAFGGETPTATDAAVALGRARVGEVEPDIGADVLTAVDEDISERIERAVEKMKTRPEPVPVAVVGGGSILAPESIAAASEVVQPDHYEVANAIGAAISQVSGQVDRVFSLEDRSREDAIAAAKETAMERARAAGAAPDSIEVVSVEEVPLSYLPGNAIRIEVKAAGDIALGGDT